MNHSPFVVGNFQIKSIKEDEPDNFIVEGFASVYGNMDSYRDIVMPGSFAKDLLENGCERPILWQHNSNEPIGMGTFEERGEAGLFVTIKMPKSDDFVSKRVMPQIRVGAVKGLSIGYWTLVEEYDREARINRLKECKLRETSVVTFPANELAQITAAKQFLGIDEPDTDYKLYPIADEKTDWNESEAIKSIKENTGSTESPSKFYGRGFLKIDGKEDDFKSYSMPYVKYIDGEFKIIPKAIYAIAGKISKSSDQGLKDFVNQIYKKRGQEEPFKGNQFFIDTATLKNIKDADAIFSNNTILSTGAKEEIIKALRSPDLGGSVSKNDELSKAIMDLNKACKGE